jgi:flavin reductase (DIM6/NTAB) family NADH-FMN oxidoreductase RutF
MDPQIKKTALRMITHGLYLLSVEQEGRFNASTVGVKANTLTHTMVEKSGQFAINLLAIGQTEMAQAFFKHAEVEGNKLSGFTFEPGSVTGAPLFLDAPAWIECKITDFVKRGDHSVVVAQVVDAGVRDVDAKPMALRDTSWHYGG